VPHGDSLPVIWITVTPVPVVGLLFAAQLNESTLLVVLGLVPLVRAVFIAVPRVIVLVALVVLLFSPCLFSMLKSFSSGS
jgi:xanthine/uracil permease